MKTAHLKDNSARDQVTFKCGPCKHTFSDSPGRVEDEESRAHPFRYFADCPNCLTEVQQVNWEVGNFSSIFRSTGPKTADGKVSSAGNLAGHPTPDEVQRIRLNALKHGAFAKTALTFPAKPGKYPQCANCDVDRDYCAAQPACIKKTELLMQHLIAFESGDPSKLTEINAINQAHLSSLFSDMVQTIAVDGVSISNPIHHFSPDGGFHIGKYDDPITGNSVIMEEIKAHPLLKPLLELVSKNKQSAADLSMTPKVHVDQNIQMGNLQQADDNKQSAAEHQEKMQKDMGDLRSMINRSREKTKTDPILLEHQQDGG
jgi:hypothetical protein